MALIVECHRWTGVRAGRRALPRAGLWVASAGGHGAARMAAVFTVCCALFLPCPGGALGVFKWWWFLPSPLDRSPSPLAPWLLSVGVCPLPRLRGWASLSAKGRWRIQLCSPVVVRVFRGIA